MTIKSQPQVPFYLSRALEHIDLGNGLMGILSLATISIMSKVIHLLDCGENSRSAYSRQIDKMMKAIKPKKWGSMQVMIKRATQRVCLITRGS